MANDLEFNLPEFVRTADSSLLDAKAPGTFSVGGFRLDNPAAVWHAAATIRKSASEDYGQHVRNVVEQACNLFGITDDMFVRKEASNPADERTVTLTDGTNVASFCIVDKETLDAAADSVIEKRASLPYGFAHDCAQTVYIMANHLGLKMDSDKEFAIKKIAGELDVDYSKGRKALERRAAKAEQFHMTEAASVLRKLANLCTDDCDKGLACGFVLAADEFDRSLTELQKTASGIVKGAEDDFFMSQLESISKKANEELNIDGFSKIRRGQLEGVNTLAISKWASELGYDIANTASPEAIVSEVGRMPRVLREEFVNLFA
jgi:hypothetical protein